MLRRSRVTENQSMTAGFDVSAKSSINNLGFIAVAGRRTLRDGCTATAVLNTPSNHDFS
jgi:hypothetical protein